MWKKRILMRFYKKKKSLLTSKTAYAACLRKLNRRDYSYTEMRDFLLEQEMDLQEIDELLQDFLQNNYINDRRYAECIYTSWLDGSLKGKIYLVFKLQKYKVAEEIIREYADADLQVLELQRAKLLLKKYLKRRQIDLHSDKIKIYNYLKNQGYSPRVINNALNEYTNDFLEEGN